MFPRKSTSIVIKFCLVAVLLKPSISIDSPSSDQETRYPSPKNQTKGPHLPSSGSITHLLSSSQPINQLNPSKLDNLTQPSILQKPEIPQPQPTSFSYRHDHNQYHFPQPLPPIPIYPINTNLLPQAPKPTPTYKNNPFHQYPSDVPMIQSNNHGRKKLERRDQSWPGTDTVFATKTIFISQPGAPTTVFVSNGQIINPPSPTPCTISCNNGQNPWVPPNPSPNPNVVVATVTAYSSANKFAWDGFLHSSNSFFILFFSLHFVNLFFFFGFGLVTFGL